MVRLKGFEPPAPGVGGQWLYPAELQTQMYEKSLFSGSQHMKS